MSLLVRVFKRTSFNHEKWREYNLFYAPYAREITGRRISKSLWSAHDDEVIILEQLSETRKFRHEKFIGEFRGMLFSATFFS